MTDAFNYDERITLSSHRCASDSIDTSYRMTLALESKGFFRQQYTSFQASCVFLDTLFHNTVQRLMSFVWSDPAVEGITIISDILMDRLDWPDTLEPGCLFRSGGWFYTFLSLSQLGKTSFRFRSTSLIQQVRYGITDFDGIVAAKVIHRYNYHLPRNSSWRYAAHELGINFKRSQIGQQHATRCL